MNEEPRGPDDSGLAAMFEQEPLTGDIEALQTLARVEAALFGTARAPVRLDRYVLGRRVGVGGSGVVYTAHDPELGREVAIKLLRAGVGQGHATSEAHDRLTQEAQAIARISHPNVIAVHDVGTYDLPELEGGSRGVFVVMELVAGQEVGAWIEAAPRSWAEVLELYKQAGRGLEAAHKAGLVHRDFKPANMLVGTDGRVRVVDFGLAVPMASEHVEPAARLGTPRYMAPEQHRGLRADSRSDQFSYCVALYEALFGVYPFVGESAEELAKAKAAGGLQSIPPEASAPRWLVPVLARGMAPDPADRYPDFHGLLVALSKQQSEPSRPRWMFAALFGIAGLAGLGALLIPERGEVVASPAIAPVEIRQRVAVLPFDDQTANGRLDFSREGLPHLLERELGRSEALEVFGVYRIRERMARPDAPESEWIRVAGEMGATILVRGQLVSDGDAIAVNLSISRDGTPIAKIERRCAVEDVPGVVRSIAPQILAKVTGTTEVMEAPRDRPFEFERQLQLAVAALERDEIAAAGDHLDAALAIDPRSGEAHYYMALRASWLRDHQNEAAKEIEAALAGELTPAQRGLMEGFAAYVSQDFVRAIELLNRQHALFPTDRYALYSLFEAAFHGGEPQLAMEAYRKMRRVSPRFNLGSIHARTFFAAHGDVEGLRWAIDIDPPTDARRNMWQVRVLLAERKHEQAIAELGRILAAGEGAGWAQEMMIQGHALAGVFGLAQEFAQQLAETSPDSAASALRALAWATEGSDSVSLRTAVYRAASRSSIDFDAAEAWSHIAAMEAAGANPQQLTVLADILDRATDPRFVRDLQLARTLIHGLLGDWEFVDHAAASPFPEVKHVALAFIAERGRNDRDAVQHWQAAAAASADGRFLLVERWRAAEAAARLGDHSVAIKACDRVIDPSLFYWSWGTLVGPCLALRAESALRSGDLALALADATRLIEQRSKASANDLLRNRAERVRAQIPD